MRAGPSSLLCAVLCLSFSPGSIAQQNPVQPRITQAIDEAALTVLRGDTHPLALARYDRGTAPPSLPMERMLLVLKRSPEQDAALVRLLDEQQDKSSPNYHKWLTPDQFGKQFGPADTDVQAVTSWLQTHGFQIAKVSKGRSVIEFSGTAAMVQEAFHTAIHNYVVAGEPHLANANDLRIPSALTPVVAGVQSLHDFKKKPQLKVLDRHIQAIYKPGNPPKVSFGGNPPLHALGPADYRTIYNANPIQASGITGQGITIAVVGRSNLFGVQGGFNQPQDIQNFRGIFNLCCGTVNVYVNGADPGDLGGTEELEATLDASWAGALAPNANIAFVVSASTNTTDGVDLSELYIIDNNLAPIMTESFGSCEQGVTAAAASSMAALAEQAAAQGITYLVSSGDSGSAGCDDPTSASETQGLSVNVLASSPYTVAVGGTMFNENGQDSKYWSSNNSSVDLGSALSYIPENVWNESCTSVTCGANAGLWSGGGGSSILFNKPSWQASFGPSDGARDLPDVSLTAAGHDPYLICLEGSCIPDARGFISFAGVAGTSASAPSFAGIMALIDQQMKGPQGQADYVLYRLAASETFSQCSGSNPAAPPSGSCTFYDTTVGNNCVPGETGYPASCATYKSSSSYDLATGFGSVNISNLVNNWSSADFNATTTTLALSPSPTSITHGSAVTANVSVTGNSGMPTGDVALLPQGSDTVVNLCTPLKACTLIPGTGTTGTASVTTHSLPGGTYNLQAYYAGDGNFGSSASTPASVTINPEASNTTLVVASAFDAGGNPVPFTTGPYGGLMYLLANVKGKSGFGTPTGTVQFTDNGTVLNASGQEYALGQLNSSGMAWTPNGFFSVGVGTRSIAASYGGDASFNPSTSSTTTVTITQAVTTATLSLVGSISGATTIVATIDTQSRGIQPTGTVSFYSGNTLLGSATLTQLVSPPGSNAQSAAFINSPISGSPSLTAVYSGDTNYLASTSAAVLASPDFVLMSNAGAGVVLNTRGQTSTTRLTVSPVDAFTGSVAFSCSGLPAGATCTFSPASVNIGASDSFVNSMVTLKTAAPNVAVQRPIAAPHSRWWTVLGMTLAMGFVLIPGSWKSKARKLAGARIFLLALLLSFIACGGGSSNSNSTSGPPPVPPNPVTPVGSYVISCTATSGNISHTVSFTLVVQ